MLKIRLRRVGSRNQPLYRLVVAEARSPRNGAVVEVIGHYNPRSEPATVVVDEEKALLWLRRGAQPTEPVARLLGKLGILEKPKEAASEGTPSSPEGSSS